MTAVSITTLSTGYTFAYIRNVRYCICRCSSLSGVQIDVIVEIKGGHGKNAIKELGGFFVMLNTSFEGVESGSGSDVSGFTNDFRRVALLRDPTSGGSAATATTLRATKAIRFDFI